MKLTLFFLLALLCSSYKTNADEYFYVPEEVMTDDDGYNLDTRPLDEEERKVQEDFEMQEEVEDEEKAYQIEEE